MFLQRRNSQELQALSDVDYGALNFEKLPWWVRLRLKTCRREILDLGFQEIIVFTRKNMRGLNYSCVLVSPDGRIIAPVEFVMLPPLAMILSVLFMPKKSHQLMFGIAGVCLTTVFPPLRRVYTTKLAYLAEGHIEGEKEFHVVDPQVPCSQMLEMHHNAISEFSQRFGESPRVIRTPDDYLRFDQEAMNNLRNRCEKRL